MLYGLDTGFEASGDRLRVAQRQLDSSGGQRGGSQEAYGPPDSRSGPLKATAPAVRRASRGGSQGGYGPSVPEVGRRRDGPPHFRGGQRGAGPSGSQGGYGHPVPEWAARRLRPRRFARRLWATGFKWAAGGDSGLRISEAGRAKATAPAGSQVGYGPPDSRVYLWATVRDAALTLFFFFFFFFFSRLHFFFFFFFEDI